MGDGRRYYHAYEDRYASVYSQGAEHWTADPQEIRDTTGKLQDFLDRWGLGPGRARLVEFGCGEGHLAQYLVQRGYAYRGVDLSPSGLAKARWRLANLGATADVFVLVDIADLSAFRNQAFDAAIDNFCLHMLVTDGDRQRYLAAVRLVLKPGGVALFHENHANRPIRGPVETFESFVSQGGFTPGAVDQRTVRCGETQRTIRLARLPFRAQDEAGYRREMTTAGLGVQHFTTDGAGHCVIHARRSD